MGEGAYVFPPDAWRRVLAMAGEPEDSERDGAEVIVEAMRRHPSGHDCPLCDEARAAAQAKRQ